MTALVPTASAAAGAVPASPPHPVGLTCWGDGPDQADEAVLVCRTVVPVTHDVSTFVFEAEGAQLFHFDPGQFVTLRLDVDGRDVERSYTISSPPTRPHLLSITVKRQPGGLVSPWLHDRVTPGARVRATPPLGAFSIARHPAPRHLVLSAGSGITPVMSMVRTLADLASGADAVFVHSARTPADVIFRRELEALSEVCPGVRVVVLVSGGTGLDAAGPGASGAVTWVSGRLDADALARHVPDAAEREVFTCGPDGYRSLVRDLLAAAGADPARCHEETFRFERLSAGELVEPVSDAGDPAAAGGGRAAGTFPIEFVRSGRTIECAPDENILDAAFRAGMTPPSSCSEGLCGTCKTVKLDGEVEMTHQGGIRPREVAAGKVLICCSKPLGPVRLDA